VSDLSTLRAPDGAVLLTYKSFELADQQVAYLAEVGAAGPDAAATAALHELPGWVVVTTDEAFAELLAARSATPRRHAHVHSRDLDADPAPREWATPALSPGLRLTPWNRSLEDIAEVQLAAYPEGHPDFQPRDGIADIVGQDLRPYAVDGAFGPVLPASGLVVEGDSVVALLLVNDRPGSAPDGGPWVTDVARRPGTSYSGTGRALLQRGLSILTTDGRPSLSLAVTDANSAGALYEDLGIRRMYSSRSLLLPG
jgi:hypothetical protein